MFRKFVKKLYFFKQSFAQNLRKLFSKPIDDSSLEELEQTLFEADVGSTIALSFVEKIKNYHYSHPKAAASDYLNELKNYAKEILTPKESPSISQGKMQIFFIVGINGSGKTTSCAKLAHFHHTQGHKTLLVAADTFRQAAVEQLEFWAEKIHVPLVKGQTGGDPSAVVYDALNKAKSQGFSHVIVDTAGRLESKGDLMEELKKMRKVIQKLEIDCEVFTWIVLDATLGQTALEQTKIFHKYTPLNGILLTKLDGTAKGGVVLAIHQELNLPIVWVGTGEGIDQFQPFDVDVFVESLFGE